MLILVRGICLNASILPFSCCRMFSDTSESKKKKTQRCTARQRLSKPTALTLTCSVIYQPMGQDEISLDHWLLIHFVIRSDGWSSSGRTWQLRQTSSGGTRLLQRHGDLPNGKWMNLQSPVTMWSQIWDLRLSPALFPHVLVCRNISGVLTKLRPNWPPDWPSKFGTTTSFPSMTIWVNLLYSVLWLS